VFQGINTCKIRTGGKSKYEYRGKKNTLKYFKNIFNKNTPFYGIPQKNKP